MRINASIKTLNSMNVTRRKFVSCAVIGAGAMSVNNSLASFMSGNQVEDNSNEVARLSFSPFATSSMPGMFSPIADISAGNKFG